MRQAKIALTGKNLQDEHVSLGEKISTAAGPVLGMCKNICRLIKAANGNGFRERFPILDVSNLPHPSMPECLGKATRGIEQHVATPRRNVVTAPQSESVGVQRLSLRVATMHRQGRRPRLRWMQIRKPFHDPSLAVTARTRSRSSGRTRPTCLARRSRRIWPAAATTRLCILHCRHRWFLRPTRPTIW